MLQAIGRLLNSTTQPAPSQLRMLAPAQAWGMMGGRGYSQGGVWNSAEQRAEQKKCPELVDRHLEEDKCGKQTFLVLLPRTGPK